MDQMKKKQLVIDFIHAVYEKKTDMHTHSLVVLNKF